MKKILYIILIFFIVTNCTTKKVIKHHGVPFLEKKQASLIIDKSNKNDIKKLLGLPSTKSKFDNDVWIYIERKITNTHFLGKRELIVNNVLVLEIDERGLLAKIDFYDIEDMKKINFDNDNTQIVYGKKSFVYDFLASLRQKINDPLGVRKKRREQSKR